MTPELAAAEEAIAAFSSTHRHWVLPLLRALDALGGSAKPKDAIVKVGELIAGRLNEAQWPRVVKNNYVRWSRHHVMKIGLVAGPHGRWELTALGRQYLDAHREDAIEVPDDIEELDELEVGDPTAPLETVSVTGYSGYEVPILEVLSVGPTQKQELFRRLFERLATDLLPGDARHMPAGHVVWQYRASWTLTMLKKGGEVRNPALGMWEITEAGRLRVEAERGGWDIRQHQQSQAKVRALAKKAAGPEPDGDSVAPESAAWTLDAWKAVRKRIGPALFDAIDARVRPELGAAPELARPVPRNIVLYGPPGTGKTFVATQIARALTGEDEPGPESHWRIVQFHPSYAYEDFVQGLRPDLELATLRYKIQPGPFLQICRAAEDEPDRFHVLVIDEINRGDPARIFGELLYGLEYRGESVDLAAGGQLNVPPNLVIVGTMNSVDRSVALVDYALRRRFAFVRVEPSPEVITAVRSKSALAPVAAAVLAQFNTWISEQLDREHAIGHSFFLSPALALDDASALDRVWALDIAPLLEEYFFGDRESLDEATKRWKGAVSEALAELSEAEADETA